MCMEKVSGDVRFECLNFVLFASISIWLLIGFKNHTYWVIKQCVSTHLIFGIFNILIVVFII